MVNELFEKLVKELAAVYSKLECWYKETLIIDEISNLIFKNGHEPTGYDNIPEELQEKIKDLNFGFSSMCYQALNGSLEEKCKVLELSKLRKKFLGDKYEVVSDAINFLKDCRECFDSNGINKPINDLTKFYAILLSSKMTKEEINRLMGIVICFDAKYASIHSNNKIKLIKQVNLVAGCYSKDYSIVSGADCREFIIAMNKLIGFSSMVEIIFRDVLCEESRSLNARDFWLLSGGSYDQLINSAGDLIHQNFYTMTSQKMKACHTEHKNSKVYNLETQKEFLTYCIGEFVYSKRHGEIPDWSHIQEVWGQIWNEISPEYIELCHNAFKRNNNDLGSIYERLSRLEIQLQAILADEIKYVDTFGERGVINPVYDLKRFFSIIVGNPLFAELEISRVLGLVIYFNSQYIKKYPNKKEKFKDADVILKLGEYYSPCGSCNKSVDDLSSRTEFENLWGEIIGNIPQKYYHQKFINSDNSSIIFSSNLWQLAVECAKFDLEYFPKKSPEDEQKVPKYRYCSKTVIPAGEQQIIDIVNNCFQRRGEQYTCTGFPSMSGNEFIEKLYCMPDNTYNFREKRNIKDALKTFFGLTLGTEPVWLNLSEEDRIVCWFAKFISSLDLNFSPEDDCSKIAVMLPYENNQLDCNDKRENILVSKEQYEAIKELAKDLNEILKAQLEVDSEFELISELISAYKEKLDGKICWIKPIHFKKLSLIK